MPVAIIRRLVMVLAAACVVAAGLVIAAELLDPGADPPVDAASPPSSVAPTEVTSTTSALTALVRSLDDPTDRIDELAPPGDGPTSTHAPTSKGALTSEPPPTSAAAATNPPTLAPSTSHTMTMLTDSVALGAQDALTARIPDWQVEVVGRPALMIHQATDDLLSNRTVGSVVVVALGYNSLWEKDRARYDAWAEKFDGEADALIADLQERGAQRVVWVTLRELTPELVAPGDEGQYAQYAWYFPYVNERIRLLPDRHPRVVVADWAEAGGRPGLTYDIIHLNPDGADLMSDVITSAAGIAATVPS